MQITIQVPATLLPTPPSLGWGETLSRTGMSALEVQEMLREVADLMLETDPILGADRAYIIDFFKHKWGWQVVDIAIDQTLNYIGGFRVCRLYSGKVVIIPPARRKEKPKAITDLPHIATVDEINMIMADLNMTPAQLGRALGASTKNASKSVYAWIRGAQKPSRATTEKLRALMSDPPARTKPSEAVPSGPR